MSLALARRGERTGCTRFVNFHQRAVFAVIGRIVGPRGRRDLIEDLAQETFLRALRALPRFDPTGPARVSTWLYTIAARVALSERARKRLETAPLGAAPELATRPFRELETRQSLERAADALTPEQRAVFVLRDVHGLTESEVASALELEVAAVKSRLFRARARLRTVLRLGDS